MSPRLGCWWAHLSRFYGCQCLLGALAFSLALLLLRELCSCMALLLRAFTPPGGCVCVKEVLGWGAVRRGSQCCSE